jgi:hypothetical protein
MNNFESWLYKGEHEDDVVKWFKKWAKKKGIKGVSDSEWHDTVLAKAPKTQAEWIESAFNNCLCKWRDCNCEDERKCAVNDFAGDDSHSSDGGNVRPVVSAESRMLVRKTVKTFHENVEKEEDELLETVRFSGPHSNVEMSFGCTINLGNHQFAKILIGLSRPCYLEEEDEAFNLVSEKIIKRLGMETEKLHVISGNGFIVENDGDDVDGELPEKEATVSGVDDKNETQGYEDAKGDARSVEEFSLGQQPGEGDSYFFTGGDNG